MRERRVVAVHAVFDQQLPVGAHRVFELALDELHVAKVEGVVDDRERVTHVAFEALDVGVVADEDQPAMVAHLGNRFEAEGLAVEGFAIGLFAGDALEFAARAVDPAVIEAAEVVRAAALQVPADQVAAMAAGVEQRADLAVVAGDQDQRAAADAAGDEVAGVGEFRHVAGEQPGAIEDQLPLEFEDLPVDEDAAVDPEDAFFPIVIDETGRVATLPHRFPLQPDPMRLPLPGRLLVRPFLKRDGLSRPRRAAAPLPAFGRTPPGGGREV